MTLAPASEGAAQAPAARGTSAGRREAVLSRGLWEGQRVMGQEGVGWGCSPKPKESGPEG